MSMVSTIYQTNHGCDDATIIHVLVVGFTGQLKGWWDEHFTNLEKSEILDVLKIDVTVNIVTDTE